ncbi:hypothetical protein GIB67_034531 [Kingdonia uniflora]|uniref:TATA-binding protein-associated factor BTAF1 n=1 Tax=Kingdonia uniflora TaxID=39325 RepID=A0A7J7PB69_9MAGN|nr:hypothetical protein GIB67_034531 [Kingdonia uniflora]
MTQQSSRLHRLLTLLDTGSTQQTRFTAARQIGDIAKSHPQDLSSLLKKVSQYLRSKSWDTRVAAAHAVGAIAENVKHTSLKELFASVKTEISDAGVSGSVEDVVISWTNFDLKVVADLSFRSFDISKVLEFGALLASGGQEYDIVADNSKNLGERLARQKQNLRRRLGLDVCEQFMDVNDMIKDEDLIANKFNSHGSGTVPRYYTSQSRNQIQQLVANMVPNFISKRPSARELNLLKRKAKINAKDQSKSWSEEEESEVPQSGLPKVVTCADQSSSSEMSMDVVLDENGFGHDGEGHWPFQYFVEQLILDMFDPTWEVRHGSMMALREVLSQQGGSAGVFMHDLSSENSYIFEGEEKYTLNTLKRERELDLNVQVDAEESEPDWKRQKSEDVSHPLISTTATINKEVDLGVILKMEDGGASLIPVKVGRGLSIRTVKVDPDAYLDNGLCFHTKEVGDTVKQISYCQATSSTPEIGTPSHPGDSKLTKLITLTRNSWLRNWEFLQECAIRFLCVLSLDRFGDYVSDQVVAPVRETCAQSLGTVLKYMHPLLVHETLKILLQMQRRPEWEIRHGSLLGMKYLVAVRREMLDDLLGFILPACKVGLEDPDDDVRAVAAEALVPAAGAIVSLNGQMLHSIVMLLWDILLDLDDLSPSTSSVLNLLAEIYSQKEMIPKMFGELTSKEKQEFDLNEALVVDGPGEGITYDENPSMLSTLAPRLWPFMRHNISSVRHSAIRTLERLLEAGCRRGSSECSDRSLWPSLILGDTLRIVFQNLLLEANEEIMQCSERVWRLLLQCQEGDLEIVARSYYTSWIDLATTPYGSTLDPTKMFWPIALPRKSHFRVAAKMRAANLEKDYNINFGIESEKETFPHEKNGVFVKIIVGADGEKSVTHTRVVTATALGSLASKLPEESLQLVIDSLWSNLKSFSGVQRQVTSMIVVSWFKELQSKGFSGMNNVMSGFIDPFREWLLELLACSDPAFPTKDSILPYDELSRTYAKMRSEASLLVSQVDSSSLLKRCQLTTEFEIDSVSVDDAIEFASKLSLSGGTGEDTNEKQSTDDLESLRQRLLTTSGYLKCVQSNLHVTVSSLIAASVVWMSKLPGRLNPVILPLMASIKREQEEILQLKAAEALAELISSCIPRKPSPNDKLIKNLCSLICMDPCETPQAAAINSMEVIEDQDLFTFGRRASNLKKKVHLLAGGEERSMVEGFISRRGSELALKHLCDKFGATLFDKLPKLWDCLTEVLKPETSEGPTHPDFVKDPQILINNIQVVRSIAPLLEETLRPKLLTLLPCIFKCVSHLHVAVRLAASRCITSMAKAMAISVMGSVIEKAVPMLGDTSSIHARQGAGMLVRLLVEGLGMEMVPYSPLLVVPLLRCMSDSDPCVRQSVTHSFAALVPLLPLARGLPPPLGLGEGVSSRSTEDAQFLEQLLDNSHIDDYKLFIEIKVALRRYQQEGINWLSFLKRFKLHGILCDDMGLGKTLQASAIVASDIAERRASNNGKDLLSLIICPSTLVGHWAYEIEKYIDTSVMKPLQYVGSVLERTSLRCYFEKHNVIITSYDVVRKDIDYLGELDWNYCILDEGHIIKNSKSKITGAVKQLKAEHRLILSGTPIQNNILELWSLFDFLMPGFLGTERQFQAAYGKPLLASKDSKCSAKFAEAGALAMEALHKQVMPFLLRRTKDEVLSDLPEKIIQDRYCDLSPVQLKLYEQFSGSDVRKDISTLVKVNEAAETPEADSRSPKASSHVFQALKYLLKLCSHPLLVVDKKSPDSLMSILSELISGSDIMSDLRELHHSPKLVALQEILEECGIGMDISSSEGSISVGQHRVLIFAQHKGLLDIIERDLFRTHMKSITYLRLDGSVETEKRFDIVKAFNSDPTIDVLLLTTHVGGLGLNLTSADTLIFMEHDWNPMRDHQAMDRAHRLGQRKVVNVHRLIMRGTLEEKVMSLQKFKVSVANAIINAENASLKTMNTDQLLDLFTSAQPSTKPSSKSSDGNLDGEPKAVGGGKGLKAILGGLEELWDQSQYTEEYDVNQFLAKLNG